MSVWVGAYVCNDYAFVAVCFDKTGASSSQFLLTCETVSEVANILLLLPPLWLWVKNTALHAWGAHR